MKLILIHLNKKSNMWKIHVNSWCVGLDKKSRPMHQQSYPHEKSENQSYSQFYTHYPQALYTQNARFVGYLWKDSSKP